MGGTISHRGIDRRPRFKMRHYRNWMGTIRLPIGKPWFTGVRPFPSAWEGWSLIIGFALWIIVTAAFFTSSDALGIAWASLSILALVIGVGIKTQTRI
jgi:hypothetical protein